MVLGVGALICVTVLAYFPVLGHEFLYWDDAQTVWNNPRLNPPTVTGLAAHWTSPAGGLYIPVTYTVWWGAAELSPGPALFHGLNLLAHILAGVAVLLLLRRLVDNDWAALGGAMLFALHPVQVEAVAWVSGFKDVLCGLLSLGALWQYVVFVQAREISPRPARSAYLAAVVLFLLALLSKPTAVVVPALAGAIDLLVLCRGWRLVAKSIVPMLLIAVPWMILTAMVQETHELTTGVSLWLRPLVAADASAFYLAKLIAPIRLTVDYGRTPRFVVSSGWIYVSWLLPAVLAVLLWLLRRQFTLLIPAAVLFVVALAPTLGIVPFQFQEKSTVADHYLYLPLLGASLGAANVLARSGSRLIWGFLLAIVVIISLLTARQVMYWRDTESLFTHTLEVNPRSWVANTNLSTDLLDRHARLMAAARSRRESAPKLIEEANQAARQAEGFARRAVELKPQNVDALVNLGSALAMQERIAEAVAPLQRAIALRPDLPDAHSSLAAAFGELGRIEEAMDQCQEALRLDPHNAAAQIMLPRLRQAQQRPATTRASG